MTKHDKYTILIDGNFFLHKCYFAAKNIANGNMDFIDLVNSNEDRDCESKKKVSFAQRSPIYTRKSKISKTFDSLGHSFSIEEGEVIESALFDRVKRDCGGKLIGVTSVRRFRKVGSDEWFSVEASEGNDTWDADFIPSSDEEAIIQGNENSGKGEGEGSGATVSYATNFGIVNIRDIMRTEKEAAIRNKNLVNGAIISSVIVAGLIGVGLVRVKKASN